MPRDKTESHKKVLAAAREELMEYGFENASMRRIGERCGIAYRCLETLEAFFLPGWKHLLGA